MYVAVEFIALFVVLPAVIAAWGDGTIFLVLWGMRINWSASSYAWGSFLYLALVSQLFAFFAWYQGMALGGVAKVGQLQLLQTFVTLIAAWALLGEQITWLQIAFACLVVAIVAIGRTMRVDRPKS